MVFKSLDDNDSLNEYPANIDAATRAKGIFGKDLCNAKGKHQEQR